MPFAIMRVEKLHQKGQIAASAAHLSRERECLNADPDRKRDNQILEGAKSTAGVLQRWERRLANVDRKVRPDAVTCMEFVITASPEWYSGASRSDQDRYHKSAISWIEKKFGKENVIQAVCHRDEKTPHLHVLVTPVLTKKNAKGRDVVALCAKDYLGSSTKLSALQTDFAKVAEPFGLERGVRGSIAHHSRVKGFYGTLEREDPAPAIELPKKRIFEGRKAYRERATVVAKEISQGWAVAIGEVAEKKAERKLAARATNLAEAEYKVRESKARVEAQSNTAVEILKEAKALKISSMQDASNRYADLSSQILAYERALKESQEKLKREIELRKEIEEAHARQREKRLEREKFILEATPEQFKALQDKWREDDRRAAAAAKNKGFGIGD